MNISENINSKYDNFLCPCCGDGADKISQDVIMMFESLRAYIIKKINKKARLKISSGYRCKAYNQDLKDRGFPASPVSRHMRGLAFDLHPIGITPKELVDVCMELHNRQEILTGELVVYDWGVHIASGSYRFKDFRS